MIIKIKPLNGHVVATSFFVNGHYLAKDKKTMLLFVLLRIC